MNTNWQEILDRVELKIGDTIDKKDFVTLANSAISELGEIAHVTATPLIYKEEDFISKDRTFEIDFSKLTQLETTITLPFYFIKDHHEISITNITCNDTDPTSNFCNVYNIELEELGSNYAPTNKIKIKGNLFPTNSVTVTGKITIVKRDMRNTNRLTYGYYNNRYQNYPAVENKIVLPNLLNYIVKLEAKDYNNMIYKGYETSISSFKYNEISNTYGVRPIYFRNGDQTLTVITTFKPSEFLLHYVRRMNKISTDISFTEQAVELDSNFENLLVFSISHKYLENFVGINDNETQAIYQKYMLLKREYEESSLARQKFYDQSEIEVL